MEHSTSLINSPLTLRLSRPRGGEQLKVQHVSFRVDLVESGGILGVVQTMAGGVAGDPSEWSSSIHIPLPVAQAMLSNLGLAIRELEDGRTAQQNEV